MNQDILKQENENLDELLSVKYLTPDNCSFRKTSGGFAALTVGEKDYGKINIIRTFPFTAPSEYLSIRKSDGKNEEIGIIEKLNNFDTDTVKLIETQLDLRYFMPQVTKIYSIKEEYGHAYWFVNTDKGKCKFSTSAGSGGSVLQLGDRIIITDSNENRYEIKDVNSLSQKELKSLELYL